MKPINIKKALLSVVLVILSALTANAQQSLWVGQSYTFDVSSSVMGLTANVSWSTNGGYLSLSGSGFYRTITVTQYFSGTATVTCEWDYKLTGNGSYTHTKRQVTISCRDNQVSILPSSMILSPGESRYVSYRHQYDNQYTTYADAYFQSSDPRIATVNERTGEVTAVSIGTTYINVYSKISSESPYCKVTVSNNFGQDPNPNPDPNPSQNDYEIIDLGLSINWASKNVGAKSDSDRGDYFAWGEIVTKNSFTESNSKTYNVNMFNSPEFVNNDYCLVLSMDAAYMNMGTEWRMPTEREIDELINKCVWTFTKENGTTGYNVKGPSGNSIFLPITTNNGSNFGQYWSGYSGMAIYDATGLAFNQGTKWRFSDKRYEGYCVRGVTKEIPQKYSGIGAVVNDTKRWFPYGIKYGIIISKEPLNQIASVFSMTGILVYSGFNEYIEVPSSGVYFVKIGDSNYKVYVP